MTGTTKTAARIGLSVLLLAAVLLLYDPARIGRTLLTVSPVYLLGLVALQSLDRLLMAFKWWLLLRAERLEVSLPTAVRAYYISSYAGLFLPMTVGADVVRTLTLRRTGETARVVTTIVLERGIGFIAQLMVCLLSALLIVQLGLDVELGLQADRLVLMTGLLLVLLAGALPLSFPAARWLALWVDGPGTRAKLATLARTYAEAGRHRGTIRVFFLLTLLENLFPVTIYWGAARALGLDFSYAIFLATVPIVYLVARLPVSLGGIGVVQFGFVSLAGTLGMVPADASSITLLDPITLILALLPGAYAYLFSSDDERRAEDG